jgi:soluble lytic murein transglycosylase-like protein
MYSFRGLGDTSSVQALISSLAPSYGIPPSLALAVANQESSFNESAVSPAGAIGVMQLMPGTASDLGVDPTDVTQNVQGGLSYLQQMFAKFGNWTQALEAYNAGPNSSNLAGSSGYASSILSAAGPLDSTSSDPGSLDAAASDLGSSLTDSSGSVSTWVWVALAAAAGLAIWEAA